MSRPRFTVAVFPCASGIGQEIFHALDGHKDIALYGINSGESNSGSRLFAERYVGSAPPMTESNALIRFMRREVDDKKIQFIFPAYDDAVVWLKTHESELGVRVIAPSLETIVVCRSKTKTYDYLGDIVRVPRVYNNPKEDDLPVFVKPDAGEGAKRCRTAWDEKGLDNLAEDEICVEYFPGDEYTIDCFTKDGETVSFPRARNGVKAGLSVHTSPVDLPECEEMAKAIAERLQMEGAWFFQCKVASGGELGLLEVAPRIAGAMSLRRYSGINFPLLSLMCFAGEPARVLFGEPPKDVIKMYKDSVLYDRDFDAIFCDLDDTLIKTGRACPHTVSFLYKWVDRKEIVLITRHAGDPGVAIVRAKLSPSLFSRVIHLRNNERKSDYVKDGSVFIDDSFRERCDVMKRRRRVICLDVDALSANLVFKSLPSDQ